MAYLQGYKFNKGLEQFTLASENSLRRRRWRN
jgi:hypothetical protein